MLKTKLWVFLKTNAAENYSKPICASSVYGGRKKSRLKKSEDDIIKNVKTLFKLIKKIKLSKGT